MAIVNANLGFMSDAERNRYLAENADKLVPRLALAITEMPPVNVRRAAYATAASKVGAWRGAAAHGWAARTAYAHGADDST